MGRKPTRIKFASPAEHRRSQSAKASLTPTKGCGGQALRTASNWSSQMKKSAAVHIALDEFFSVVRIYDTGRRLSNQL